MVERKESVSLSFDSDTEIKPGLGEQLRQIIDSVIEHGPGALSEKIPSSY